MPLNYNPEDMDENSGGGKAQPGTYDFVIDDAEEVTFRTGSQGLKLTLLVGAFETRDIKVFENCVYTPKALFRLNGMLAAVGKDFNNPPEVTDLIGLGGKAEFVTGDNGYLKVGTWLPASANNTGNARTSDDRPPEPPPLGDDDIPF